MEEMISSAALQLGYKDLRPNQRFVIENYLHGKDVLYCSPTGSGKSLTFEIAPIVFKKKETSTGPCIAIVLSPLASLMKTQVKALKMKGVKAIYLRESNNDSVELTGKGIEERLQKLTLHDLKSGDYELIFSSPESILEKYRDLVLHLSKKKYLKILFVDEAHCIKKFGRAAKGSKKSAYRPFYGRLGELRSLAGPSVPVVALTATASFETRDVILKELCIQDSFQLIVNPNKANIKYWVYQTKEDDICLNFEWLATLLRSLGKDTPRMIIFFRQIKHLSEVFEYLYVSLGSKGYANYDENGDNDDRNRLFAMYHLKTDEEIKESICDSYQDPKGNTRVVLCSTSFSMGLDVKGVDNVVHYGPANDLDDYLQETGRAGRNPDQKCHAILIRYKHCLNSKNITKEIKNYVKTVTCRRKVLLEPFLKDPSSTDILHECCDICSKACRCLCTCETDCSCANVCDGLQSSLVNQIESQRLLNAIDDFDEESELSDENFFSDSDIDIYRSKKPTVIMDSSDEG